MEDKDDNLEQLDGQEQMPAIITAPSGAIADALPPFQATIGNKFVTAITMLSAMNLPPEVDEQGRPFLAGVDIPLSKEAKGPGVHIEWRSDMPLDDMAEKLNLLMWRYYNKLENPDFIIDLKDMMHVFHFDVEWDDAGRVKRDAQGNETPVDKKTYKNRMDYLRDRVNYAYEALYGVDMEWKESFGPYDKKTKKKKYNTTSRGPHWRIVDESDPGILNKGKRRCGPVQNAGLDVHLSGKTCKDYVDLAKVIVWMPSEIFGLSPHAFAMCYNVLGEASRTYNLDGQQSFFVDQLYFWSSRPDYWKAVERDKQAQANGKAARYHYNDDYAYPFHDDLKEIIAAGIFKNVTFTDAQGKPVTYGTAKPSAYPKGHELHDAPLQPDDTRALLTHKKLFPKGGKASDVALKVSFTIKDAPHIAMPERLQKLADKKTDSKAKTKDDGKAEN